LNLKKTCFGRAIILKKESDHVTTTNGTIELIVKYGFIAVVVSIIAVGGVCGLMFLLAPIFGTL
jgi:hypothetical protein